MENENKSNVTKSGIFVTRLNLISYSLLLISLAHAVWNAFRYSENAFMTFFVLAGIVSSEVMLYACYNKLTNRDGEGYPEPEHIPVITFFGGVSLWLISCGIVAGHLGVSWFFNYILPLAAPINFLGAFLIQFSEPESVRERKLEHARKSLSYERLMQKINKRMRAVEHMKTKDVLFHVSFMNKLDKAQKWVDSNFRYWNNKRDGATIAKAIDKKAAEKLKLPGRSRATTSGGVVEGAKFVDITPGGDGVSEGKRVGE